MQSPRQIRYLPKRMVTWWYRPAARAWVGRLTVWVERALEKAAQGG